MELKINPKEFFKNYLSIKLDKLVYADWNYKTDDEELDKKLENNILSNGQVQNLIVRELENGLYEVVNGNHRLKVLKKLNYESVFCYNMGKVTVEKAQRLAIETNETNYISDNSRLSSLMSNLAEQYSINELVSTMPYNNKEFEQLCNLSDYDFTLDDENLETKTDKKEKIEKEINKNTPPDEEWISISDLFESLDIKNIPESLANSIIALVNDVIEARELTTNNIHLVFDYINALHLENKKTNYID